MSIPFVAGDSRACGLELMRTVDLSPPPEADRRRRARLALSLTVRLFRRNDVRGIETRTRNVSIDGFYCVVDEALTVGEHVRCILDMPAFHPVHRDELITLECQSHVVRVEMIGTGSFGVACAIDQYCVLQSERDTEGSGT